MSFKHLYIHVPFCRRRCTYCDFAIAVRKTVPGPRFVDTISLEMDRLATHGKDRIGPFDTVYLGGGTPSLLAPADIRRLIERVKSAFGVSKEAEVTIEVNPEDVVQERAEAWAQAGINRVSLGVQSLDRSVLEWMHRSHDADAALTAAQTIRNAGIRSLSADLIFGLPERFGIDPVAEATRVVDAIGPEHLSAYGLTVESGTALSRWVERGVVYPASPDAQAGDFLRLHEELEKLGYEHYEVSNYARPGYRSRHNQVYWTGRPYLGVGPSAHSFDGLRRWWNVRDWSAYEQRIASGSSPVANRETLTNDQLHLERVYLGLRIAEGLDGATAGLLPAESVHSSIEQGWLIQKGGVLAATPEGWLRLDALAARLCNALTTPAGGG